MPCPYNQVFTLKDSVSVFKYQDMQADKGADLMNPNESSLHVQIGSGAYTFSYPVDIGALCRE
jgi:hypothetical protein